MKMRSMLKNSRGQAATYALLILPAVLTLSTLAVDVSGWNAKRDYLQAQADRIALQAAALLPYRSAAEEFVTRAAAGLPGVTGRALLDADPRSPRIGVELSGSYTASFDFFTGGGQQRQFSTVKQSWAKAMPADSVIILADGKSLRPGLQTNATTGAIEPAAAWGDEIYWPASGYFSGVLAPEVSAGSFWSQSTWDNLWSSGAYQRWATESCFNPALSPLKLSAIALYDALSFNAQNRVGVTLTPGTDSGVGYFVLRYLRGAETLSGTTFFPNQLGGFLPSTSDTASANWLPYAETQTLLGTEACMLFAHRDLDSRYQLPTTTLTTSSTSSCTDDPLSSAVWGDKHAPFTRITDCYPTQRLSVREALYWNPAKLPHSGFDAEPKLAPAIEQALSDLVNVPDQALLQTEKTVRGNVAGLVPRKIFVLTDFLPDSADLTAIIPKLRSAKTELVFAVSHHAYLNAADETALSTRLAALRTLEEQNVLRVFETTSDEELNRLTSRMLNYDRRITLEK